MTKNMPPKNSDDKSDNALEQAYAGRLPQRPDGFYEVPTSLFVGKVDVKMPKLPEVAFYLEKEAKIQKIKNPDQNYSPLALSAHKAVLVHPDDIGEITKFAEDRMLGKRGGSDSSESKEERIHHLRKAAILVVEDLFENPNEENINKSKKVVGNFVFLMMKDPGSYLYLANLSSHDPYTLQHSVGTSVNSIILGRKNHITDEAELAELGLAGLLHDIGKVKIKKEIINKEGPLDDKEWEEMQRHSEFGYEILKNNNTISERIKRAVLEHHEDKNGEGYPNRIPWNSVDFHSKIVAISDVFNALTTTRSYSDARTPFEAFQLMRDKIMHKLDDELFGQLVLIHGGKIEDID